MRDERRRKQDVERPVAEDLIGDRNLARTRVLRLRSVQPSHESDPRRSELQEGERRLGQAVLNRPYRTTAETPATRLAAMGFEAGMIEMFRVVPEVGSVTSTAEPTALPAVS